MIEFCFVIKRNSLKQVSRAQTILTRGVLHMQHKFLIEKLRLSFFLFSKIFSWIFIQCLHLSCGESAFAVLTLQVRLCSNSYDFLLLMNVVFANLLFCRFSLRVYAQSLMFNLLYDKSNWFWVYKLIGFKNTGEQGSNVLWIFLRRRTLTIGWPKYGIPLLF